MGEGEIRVLLCDDAAGYRALVRYALEEEPEFVVVGEAADGRTALAAVAALQPDVVLLDLSMPMLDGVTAAEEIREKSPQARVLVLSSYAQEVVVTSAFRAGACGYLVKDVGSAEVLDGIRQAHAGGSPTSTGITSMDHRSVADQLAEAVESSGDE